MHIPPSRFTEGSVFVPDRCKESVLYGAVSFMDCRSLPLAATLVSLCRDRQDILELLFIYFYFIILLQVIFLGIGISLFPASLQFLSYNPICLDLLGFVDFVEYFGIYYSSYHSLLPLATQARHPNYYFCTLDWQFTHLLTPPEYHYGYKLYYIWNNSYFSSFR